MPTPFDIQDDVLAEAGFWDHFLAIACILGGFIGLPLAIILLPRWF